MNQTDSLNLKFFKFEMVNKKGLAIGFGPKTLNVKLRKTCTNRNQQKVKAFGLIFLVLIKSS